MTFDETLDKLFQTTPQPFICDKCGEQGYYPIILPNGFSSQRLKNQILCARCFNNILQVKEKNNG